MRPFVGRNSTATAPPQTVFIGLKAEIEAATTPDSGSFFLLLLHANFVLAFRRHNIVRLIL
jgi:hypothetical protein